MMTGYFWHLQLIKAEKQLAEARRLRREEERRLQEAIRLRREAETTLMTLKDRHRRKRRRRSLRYRNT